MFRMSLARYNNNRPVASHGGGECFVDIQNGYLYIHRDRNKMLSGIKEAGTTSYKPVNVG